MHRHYMSCIRGISLVLTPLQYLCVSMNTGVVMVYSSTVYLCIDTVCHALEVYTSALHHYNTYEKTCVQVDRWYALALCTYA